MHANASVVMMHASHTLGMRGLAGIHSGAQGLLLRSWPCPGNFRTSFRGKADGTWSNRVSSSSEKRMRLRSSVGGCAHHSPNQGRGRARGVDRACRALPASPVSGLPAHACIGWHARAGAGKAACPAQIYASGMYAWCRRRRVTQSCGKDAALLCLRNPACVPVLLSHSAFYRLLRLKSSNEALEPA